MSTPFEYYIIPSSEMAKNVSEAHQLFLNALGIKGQQHKDSKVRVVHIPPRINRNQWDIGEFRDRWDLIEQKLAA